MRIGIIGAGKVGTTLGKYLNMHSVPVVGFYSRSHGNAEAAAEFAETAAYHALEELVSASDTLFLATPDGEIGRVWDCIRKTGLQEKIICHFSGSLSSHVFSGIGQTGAYGCSIHPMYAFGGKFTSYQQFHTAILTLEGQRRAVQEMSALFGGRLGHKVLSIRAEDKMKYHASAALASNYMIGLFQVSLQLLEECGFSEGEAGMLLRPLVQVNVENMLEKGVQEALTGPIERNDVGTVEKHLQAINSTYVECDGRLEVCDDGAGNDGFSVAGGSAGAEAVYRELGQVLVSIAEKKNPDRDYAELRHLLARHF